MHSLAKAPPVVTNLQQNCGMKKKKTHCVGNSLVQVTVKKVNFSTNVLMLRPEK